MQHRHAGDTGERHPADAALRERLLAGDEGAAEELFRRHHGPLICLARRLVRQEAVYDAEDVVGETLLRTLVGIRRYDGSVSLRAWMGGIARKVAEKQRRKQRLSTDESPLTPRRGQDPAAEVERKDVARYVRRVLERLPDPHGEVLCLKYMNKMSGSEIAVHFGITLHAANSLLARARATFRAAIGHHAPSID